MGTARKEFKQWWTDILPVQIEQSALVLSTCVVLAPLSWQWRSLPGADWNIGHPVVSLLLWALFWTGWLLLLLSTFLITQFDLVGPRQVYLYLRRRKAKPVGFKTPWFYRLVPHPLYLGFIVVFWSTPRFTVWHLLFAAVATAYVWIAIQLEA